MLRISPRVNLRTLIFFLTFSAALSMLLSSLIVSYYTYRDALIRTSLQTDEAYAKKISTEVQDLLEGDLRRLHYSAEKIAKERSVTAAEIDRLLKQDSSFSSLVVADRNGVISDVVPANKDILGKKLISWSEKLTTQDSVSSVFMSLLGNQVIYLSTPIQGESETRQGVLGGVIHLSSDNSLHKLLSEHSFRNEAHVYLIDGDGSYLYDPNNKSLVTFSEHDKSIQSLLPKGSGSMITKEADGSAILTGYAPIANTRWGVILKQPLQVSDGMVSDFIWAIMLAILPIGTIGLLLTAWGATKISRPLQQLANGAKHLGEQSSTAMIKRVRGWYTEAWRIKQALLIGIGLVDDRLNRLNEQAYCDPLTKLPNRRALNEAISRLEQNGIMYSVLAADIDHFKHVNDTFGHNVGDIVLCRIAEIFQSQTRQGDLPCRIGGEEFLILLPKTSTQLAASLAERIRVAVEMASMAPSTSVTISFGVASWTCDTGVTMSDVLKRADQHLYQAKEAGRNQVSVGEYAFD